MPSPWVRRAQAGLLPAVDNTGAVHMVDEREARIAAGLCAIEDGWCITHETPGDFGHYLDTRKGSHNDLGFAYND
jgi:hypothetical protein